MTFNNYHTHTVFCDGANTPEEMVKAALEAGCQELGFSGHSYLSFDPEWTMEPDAAARYRAVIADLREQYKDRISLFLGVEQDYYSSADELPLYDYVIGGVHCVFKDGHYISVDLSADALKEGIEQWYGGDPYAFAEDYYALVGDVYVKTKCDIVAHFDLCTKFLEKEPLFDTTNARYRAAAEAALEKVIECPAVVELNSGAISRGYRTSCYPEEWVLETLAKAGKPVILSSDSHATDTITYGFEEMLALVKKHNLTLVQNFSELKEITQRIH